MYNPGRYVRGSHSPYTPHSPTRYPYSPSTAHSSSVNLGPIELKAPVPTLPVLILEQVHRARAYHWTHPGRGCPVAFGLLRRQMDKDTEGAIRRFKQFGMKLEKDTDERWCLFEVDRYTGSCGNPNYNRARFHQRLDDDPTDDAADDVRDLFYD